MRVWLLLLSSEFHLDGISSLSEEMDGGDLVWSAPPDCLSNNEGPPHLPLQPQGFPDLEGELTIVSSEVNKKLDQVVEAMPVRVSLQRHRIACIQQAKAPQHK